MVIESYKLGGLHQDKLISLLKILAFNFSDCEIHPFQLEDEIFIIISSKTKIEDNFIYSVEKEGFSCELLKAS